MDLQRIVAELRSERDRIDRAIASLEMRSVGRAARSVGAVRRVGGITPAGRKRLSEAMRRRWAERRAKSVKAATSTAPKSRRKRGAMSTTARKRLSEMMKKRWAERRKKTS